MNYLALDSPYIQFVAGVSGRTEVRPTARGWGSLKDMSRYLLALPVVGNRFHLYMRMLKTQAEGGMDSDWAGRESSRRSFRRCIAMVAGAVVKAWPNREGSIAASLGRAMLYKRERGQGHGQSARSGTYQAC